MTSPIKSLLFVPLSSERFVSKAVEAQSLDAVILDLEDGVCSSEKATAREKATESAYKIKETGKKVFLRINDPLTMQGVEDLLSIQLQYFDCILIPKAGPKSIIVVDTLLGALEENQGIPKRSVGIAIMVETAEGVVEVKESITASNRISYMVFGAEDYSNDLEIDKNDSRDLVDYARLTVVSVAKALGVEAIDSPCVDFRNPEVYQAEIDRAKQLGFTGKTSIHPVMIDYINQAFTPKDEEILWAKDIWNTFLEGIQNKRGAVSFQGKMIDRPIAEKAKKILIRSGILKEVEMEDR